MTGVESQHVPAFELQCSGHGEAATLMVILRRAGSSALLSASSAAVSVRLPIWTPRPGARDSNSPFTISSCGWSRAGAVHDNVYFPAPSPPASPRERLFAPDCIGSLMTLGGLD
ncbi:hypothetical protein NDU88_007511 [Pleurodeles waltl]|uniref:Uncharacterized protein n=1 Tax=Pleurodeles waltl TaxID=8319 RepID=A0AAV7QPC5_PLEWA|nr:hypothetical protein NDU88_007511 [Pleurodeles waltl]